MAKQTYIKRDLIDYVKGGVEAPEESYAHRPDWVIYNLPQSASVQYWREGGYQGKLAYVIRLDGYLWVFNDYYGSCSGCDAFMNNERGYTEDMLRDAYCFPDKESALEYIHSTDDYSWKGVRSAVEEMIEDPRKELKNPKTRFEVTKTTEKEEMTIIHKESK